LQIETKDSGLQESLWVLIPALNEEAAVGRVVTEVKKILPNVLVVNDGSTDATADRARDAGAVVLEHAVCRGKGASLQTGLHFLEKKGCEAVITMDGDGQHLVSDIPSFLSAYKRRRDIGIWVGKRKIKGTEMPFIRRATNLSMSFLLSLLAIQYIPDTQNGFRCIRLSAVKGMRYVSSHFETESEILLRASWRGVRIGAVCITTVYSDEKSKIRPSADTSRFFKMLIRLLFFACKKR
jgi:glycosyltransferase involved in cell wall biosynthesis